MISSSWRVAAKALTHILIMSFRAYRASYNGVVSKDLIV